MNEAMPSRWVDTRQSLDALVATPQTDDEGLLRGEKRPKFAQARAMGSSFDRLVKDKPKGVWMVPPAQFRALGFDVSSDEVRSKMTGTTDHGVHLFRAEVDNALTDVATADVMLGEHAKNTDIGADAMLKADDTHRSGMVWGASLGPLEGHWMTPYLTALAGARGLELDEVLSPPFIAELRSGREDKEMHKLMERRDAAVRHIDAAARSIEDDAHRASVNLGMLDQVQMNESNRTMVRKIRRLIQNFHGVERESNGPANSRVLRWVNSYVLMVSALMPFVGTNNAKRLGEVNFDLVGDTILAFFGDFASPNGPAFLFLDLQAWKDTATQERQEMVRSVQTPLEEIIKAARKISDTDDRIAERAVRARSLLLLIGVWWIINFIPVVDADWNDDDVLRRMATGASNIYGDAEDNVSKFRIDDGLVEVDVRDGAAAFDLVEFVALFESQEGQDLLDAAENGGDAEIFSLFTMLSMLPLRTLATLPTQGPLADSLAVIARVISASVLDSVNRTDPAQPLAAGEEIKGRVQEATQLLQTQARVSSVRDEQYRELEREATALFNSRMFADLKSRDFVERPPDVLNPRPRPADLGAREQGIDDRAQRYLDVDVKYSAYPYLARLDAWLRAYDELLDIATEQLAEWNVVVGYKRKALRESAAQLRSLNAQIAQVRKAVQDKDKPDASLPDILPMTAPARAATEYALSVVSQAPAWAGMVKEVQYTDGSFMNTPLGRLLMRNAQTRSSLAILAASETKQATRRGGTHYTQGITPTETKVEKAEALRTLAGLGPRGGAVFPIYNF